MVLNATANAIKPITKKYPRVGTVGQKPFYRYCTTFANQLRSQ